MVMKANAGGPQFTAGNKAVAKRRTVGRPPKMTTTIAEVCSPEELRALLRKTYERAMAGEVTSLAWILGQMPRLDSGFRLPPGLPKLDSLAGCVLAVTEIGERTRLGELTTDDAERALALVNLLAFARVSILTRSADKLDAELKAALELEQRLERGAPPAWSPGDGSGTLN